MKSTYCENKERKWFQKNGFLWNYSSKITLEISSLEFYILILPWPGRIAAGAAWIIMGEKRAYKVRKPGGDRKKLKPEQEGLKVGIRLMVEVYSLWRK